MTDKAKPPVPPPATIGLPFDRKPSGAQTEPPGKVIVLSGSIFAVLLPSGAPAWVGWAALGIVFVNEFWWYSLVAVVFSTGPTRRFFYRWKVWINRVAGTVLALLGIRLALLVR